MISRRRVPNINLGIYFFSELDGSAEQTYWRKMESTGEKTDEIIERRRTTQIKTIQFLSGMVENSV